MPSFGWLFPAPQLNPPVFSMEDFASAIAYEMKQEMANRYFGFRAQIERQSINYLKKLEETSRELNAEIHLHLCRMQFLLKEPRLFCSFLHLAGLPRDYAVNACSQIPFPKAQELFMAMRGEGFTRWRRFRGLAIVVYHSLAESIAIHHDAYLLFEEEHAEICMEINKFQRQNDLTEILSFLRNLDSPDAERSRFLHSNAILSSADTLDLELRMAPPPPVSEAMAVLTPLVPLRLVKSQFTEILKQAFPYHDCSGRSSLPF